MFGSIKTKQKLQAEKVLAGDFSDVGFITEAAWPSDAEARKTLLIEKSKKILGV